MENYNYKEYRNNLAKDLKEIRKTDPEEAQSFLDKEKNTKEYREALIEYLNEKELRGTNINSFQEELLIDTKNEKEIPLNAIDIDKFKKSFNFSIAYELNGYPEVIDFIISKFKIKNPELFYKTESGEEKIDAILIDDINKKFQESEKKPTNDWVTLGEWVMTYFHPGYGRNDKFDYSIRTNKIPAYLEPVIIKIAQQNPEDIEIFSLTKSDKQKPYIYYSKRIVEIAKKIIESQKTIKNSENWCTPYQATKQLGISRENLDRFIIEYKEKEPDYIVEKNIKNDNSLSGYKKEIFIYKELIKEIRGRVESGEKRIVPEGWLTISELAKNIQFKGELDRPDRMNFFLNFISKCDKEISDLIINAKINLQLYKKSDLILRDKNDFYLSPKLQKYFQDKLNKLQNVVIPKEYKNIGDGVKTGLNISTINELYAKKYLEALENITKKYQDKVIYKIIDSRIVPFYPPEFFIEFEKKINGIKIFDLSNYLN
jgi:hypothetical protein